MEPSRAAGPKHACKIAPRRGLIPTPLVGTPNSLAVAPPDCDGHFFLACELVHRLGWRFRSLLGGIHKPGMTLRYLEPIPQIPRLTI
jgi:hypothetical protein